MKPAFVLSLALVVSSASAHCESGATIFIFPPFLLLLTLVSSRYLSDPDHGLEVIEVGRSRAGREFASQELHQYRHYVQCQCQQRNRDGVCIRRKRHRVRARRGQKDISPWPDFDVPGESSRQSRSLEWHGEVVV